MEVQWNRLLSRHYQAILPSWVLIRSGPLRSRPKYCIGVFPTRGYWIEVFGYKAVYNTGDRRSSNSLEYSIVGWPGDFKANIRVVPLLFVITMWEESLLPHQLISFHHKVMSMYFENQEGGLMGQNFACKFRVSGWTSFATLYGKNKWLLAN